MAMVDGKPSFYCSGLLALEAADDHGRAPTEKTSTTGQVFRLAHALEWGFDWNRFPFECTEAAFTLYGFRSCHRVVTHDLRWARAIQSCSFLQAPVRGGLAANTRTEPATVVWRPFSMLGTTRASVLCGGRPIDTPFQRNLTFSAYRTPSRIPKMKDNGAHRTNISCKLCTFSCFHKAPVGNSFIVWIQDTEMVSNLKEKISSISGYPCFIQLLIHGEIFNGR